MKESPFEKLLRELRLRKIAKEIPKGASLLDVGCGWDARVLKRFSGVVAEGFGIDSKIETNEIPANVTVFRQRLETRPWPIRNASIDMATMLAVLEHVDPNIVPDVLGAIRAALKPHGRLLITVPTPRSKPVLEFLSYRLGAVNAEEIRDHKRYYDRSALEDVLSEAHFTILKYRTFQLGMNSFCIAQRR